MKEINVDVAIVGAGTAGMYALSRALRKTDSVLIFDGGELGTTCARVSCMPSKMLIHSGGILRIYADGAGGRLLGAEMAAPAGEHLAHLIATLIQARMTVEDALGLPFYHPTYEESVRDCLHILSRKLR